MAHSFDIREFDSFVDRSVLERQGLKPKAGFIALDHALFEALEAFVLENRGDGTEPLELMALGARRGYGKTITARNYVGVIAFKNGTSIQVLPKLAASSDVDQEHRVFLKMLQSVIELPFKEFDMAGLTSSKMEVMEPFIIMFLKAASDLAKRGLRGAYEEHEGNERFLKGKIDFAETIKRNVAHGERLYVRYDEFGVNRPENRLIRTTLELLRSKTRRVSTRHDIDAVLTLFADVASSDDIESDFSRCQLDRTMGAYVPVLKWCRVFLLGESYTSFKGSSVASSLLFPMETLFESFVAKEVRKAAGSHGWRAFAQDSGKYLYSDPKRFRLRPDIVLKREAQSPVVMDTKWKRIGGASNDGMSQADMYQMYAYQHRYEASKAILVYPRYEGLDMGLRREYRSDSEGGIDALTQVFVFDLMDASRSAEELVTLAIGE